MKQLNKQRIENQKLKNREYKIYTLCEVYVMVCVGSRYIVFRNKYTLKENTAGDI